MQRYREGVPRAPYGDGVAGLFAGYFFRKFLNAFHQSLLLHRDVPASVLGVRPGLYMGVDLDDIGHIGL